MKENEVRRAIPNSFEPRAGLELPESPEIITRNVLALNESVPNPRLKLILNNLVQKLHDFVKETNLSTEEWMTAIQFLTAAGQKCTDIRQEFILLSDILGVSALVDAQSHPKVGNSTQSTVLGPFFTEDANEISLGESIASEGKGEYLLVKGRILDNDGNPVPDATIETWETDEFGFYDTQYVNREKPDCRGRLKSDAEGRYEFRAVVPVAYPIPGDGPVGELLVKMRRHNMRPAHLHMMIEAEGYDKLVTSFYPEGDKWLYSDAVFGVKKSLVVSLKDVTSEAETRSKGFLRGQGYRLLEQDIVLVSVKDGDAARNAANPKV